jgi:hypothetical protein
MVAIIVGVSLSSNLLTTSGFYLIKLYKNRIKFMHLKLWLVTQLYMQNNIDLKINSTQNFLDSFVCKRVSFLVY